MLISTSSVIIHGKQGGGKTAFAVMLSSDYIPYDWIIFKPRIYGNVQIKKKGIPIVSPIVSIKQLDQFKYSKIPGVVLFDEMGLNFNSKNHATKKNQDLSSFFFLIRKFNLSSIFISQRLGSVPVDMRELVDYIFEISVIHRKNKHPIFRVERQSLDSEGFPIFEEEQEVDIIGYLQSIGLEYDTLESSIID